MRVRHLPPERSEKGDTAMRRNDLQLVPAIDNESTSVDLAEILLAKSESSAPVPRVVPQSDEDVTPDDAA
jgi:hypothetical protein